MKPLLCPQSPLLFQKFENERMSLLVTTCPWVQDHSGLLFLQSDSRTRNTRLKMTLQHFHTVQNCVNVYLHAHVKSWKAALNASRWLIHLLTVFTVKSGNGVNGFGSLTCFLHSLSHHLPIKSLTIMMVITGTEWTAISIFAGPNTNGL